MNEDTSRRIPKDIYKAERREVFLAHVTERRRLLKEALAEELDGVSRFTLEIGSGHGHWLAAYGAAHPDRFCMGVDIIGERIRKSDRKRERGGLQNVVFMKTEAVECLECLPDGVLLRDVFILFPDPWPKKRHHKNRIIQEDFLELLADRCAPGARLHFRTDHVEYFDWAMERISSHPRWKLLPEAPWPFEQETFFQQLLRTYQSLVAEVRK